MDRNISSSAKTIVDTVAPLAGSVDRNWKIWTVLLRSTLSLPSRGAWIEIQLFHAVAVVGKSLPSRGAWIEIQLYRDWQPPGLVAPLAGSVDRNFSAATSTHQNCASLPSRGAWIEIGPGRCGGPADPVAPLAGSVDRNDLQVEHIPVIPVAPLAGSVDRNLHFSRPDKGPLRSLPSRGAWIEIPSTVFKEIGVKSLPSRGAWIEIG